MNLRLRNIPLTGAVRPSRRMPHHLWENLTANDIFKGLAGTDEVGSSVGDEDFGGEWFGVVVGCHYRAVGSGTLNHEKITYRGRICHAG